MFGEFKSFCDDMKKEFAGYNRDTLQKDTFAGITDLLGTGAFFNNALDAIEMADKVH